MNDEVHRGPQSNISAGTRRTSDSVSVEHSSNAKVPILTILQVLRVSISSSPCSRCTRSLQSRLGRESNDLYQHLTSAYPNSALTLGPQFIKR